MPSRGTAVLEVIARWQGEVIAYHTLTPGKSLLVGPSPDCDLIVPQQLLAMPTELVQLDDHGASYTVSLPSSAVSLTVIDPAGTHQQQGPTQGSINHQHSSELVVGALSVQLHGAFAADPLPVWAPINWREQRGTLISAGVHLLVLALVASVAPDSFALTADTYDRTFRFSPTVHQPLDDKDNPWLHKRQADAGSKGGKRAAKERGKMGDRKASKRDRGAYAMKGKDRQNQPLGEIVASTGVLGAINSSRSASLALLLDPNQRAMSADTEQVLGGLIGDRLGPEYGVGGLALDGPGRGGGCEGGDCGLVGEGGIDGNRIGPPRGTPGWRGGWGTGKDPTGGHKPRPPRVLEGRAVLKGALSKEIIRRIVRRHLNEVRYCYQRQLQANRDLRGRVVVQFVISGNGTVVMSRIAESTLGNTSVEQCVTAAVRRWAFPKPEGGGIVTVAYPFTFHAAGR